MTEIIKEDNPEKTAFVLKQGGVIIYPTETLYGIGALASNADAVEKIFRIKGRPEGKPIPILVRDKEMLAEFSKLTEDASILADRFLPGPLTLVLGEKKSLPTLISAGTGKIAVRISRHPFVKRLFDLIEDPITSTSANISGSENILEPVRLVETFTGKVELIVDSGNLPPSKGSTVIDLTVEPYFLIREGDITKDQIGEFIKW